MGNYKIISKVGANEGKFPLGEVTVGTFNDLAYDLATESCEQSYSYTVEIKGENGKSYALIKVFNGEKVIFNGTVDQFGLVENRDCVASKNFRLAMSRKFKAEYDEAATNAGYPVVSAEDTQSL